MKINYRLGLGRVRSRKLAEARGGLGCKVY